MTTINDVKRAKLTSKGFTGAVNEQEKQFYTSLGGGTGAFPDVQYKYLGVLGYVGSLTDRLAARNKAFGDEIGYWNSVV